MGGLMKGSPSKMNKDLAYLLVFLLQTLCFIGYSEYRRSTIYVNAEKYRMVGFLSQTDEGKQLYIPVYRREK